MKFMDKVKAQAAQAAEKAQEGIRTGQAKMEEAQARKKADALLRELGGLVYAERTGRGTEETQAEISRLVAELQAQEDEHPSVAVAPEAGGAAPPPEPGGDYTLEGL